MSRRVMVLGLLGIIALASVLVIMYMTGSFLVDREYEAPLRSETADTTPRDLGVADEQAAEE